MRHREALVDREVHDGPFDPMRVRDGQRLLRGAQRVLVTVADLVQPRVELAGAREVDGALALERRRECQRCLRGPLPALLIAQRPPDRPEQTESGQARILRKMNVRRAVPDQMMQHLAAFDALAAGDEIAAEALRVAAGRVRDEARLGIAKRVRRLDHQRGHFQCLRMRALDEVERPDPAERGHQRLVRFDLSGQVVRARPVLAGLPVGVALDRLDAHAAARHERELQLGVHRGIGDPRHARQRVEALLERRDRFLVRGHRLQAAS